MSKKDLEATHTYVDVKPRNVILSDGVHTIKTLGSYKGRKFLVTCCGISFCCGENTNKKPYCPTCAKAYLRDTIKKVRSKLSRLEDQLKITKEK